MSKTPAMRYRPEIDGLRTVAVLPVILFHAGLPGFGGGFVGVDVFFVISGYLITRILAAEIAAGTFSLAAFYERRARRILPALFLVMLLSFLCAWVWMLPRDFLDFARSLVAVSLFASNIEFWRETGYFAAQTVTKPLLHTWSLAVEEQFYIVFPLVLWLFAGLGARLRLFLVALLAGLSLVWAQHLSAHDPDAAFFLPFGRAWELLAGAILALWPGAGATAPRRLAGPLSALGLAAILLPMAAFNHATPTPSFWTLPPVLGAVLVIAFADGRTLAGRLLALRPMVGIGLVSYSAYLLHQPLQAFTRIRMLDAPSPPLLAAVGLLALPLGWLSWRFVERPFRDRRVLPRRPALFAACALVSLVFIGLGVQGHLTRGWPDRLPARVVAAAQAATERSDPDVACRFNGDDTPELPVERCLSAGGPVVALIGDSHAMMYAAPLRAALAERGMGLYAINRSGCPPLPGLVLEDPRNGPFACDRHARRVLAQLDALNPAAVVVSARWTAELLGLGFDNGEGGVVAETGARHADLRAPRRAPDDPARIAEVSAAMKAALEALAGRYRLILLYPTPEAGWNVPERAGKLLLHGAPAAPLTTPSRVVRQRNAAVTALFDAIDSPDLLRVRPLDILCDAETPGRCRTMRDGRALYVDDNHLSMAGAALIVPEILRQVQRVVGP